MTDLSTSSPTADGDIPRRATRTRTRSGAFRVRVHRGVRYARLPSARIVTVLGRIGRREGSRGEIHVIVVEDRLMQDLNRRYRGSRRATDVLAFPLTDALNPTAKRPLLGEIYCNYDHARRWRAENGGTVTDELLRLAVHGCLHLLGYDHHTPRERKRMVTAEHRYLAAAGLIDRRTSDVRPGPAGSRGRDRVSLRSTLTPTLSPKGTGGPLRAQPVIHRSLRLARRGGERSLGPEVGAGEGVLLIGRNASTHAPCHSIQ